MVGYKHCRNCDKSMMPLIKCVSPATGEEYLLCYKCIVNEDSELVEL